MVLARMASRPRTVLMVFSLRLEERLEHDVTIAFSYALNIGLSQDLRVCKYPGNCERESEAYFTAIEILTVVFSPGLTQFPCSPSIPASRQTLT